MTEHGASPHPSSGSLGGRPAVAVFATLDTKRPEAARLAASIEDAGAQAVVVDMSLSDDGVTEPATSYTVISRETLLAARGLSRDALTGLARIDRIAIMVDCLRDFVRTSIEGPRPLAGVVIGVGGGTGGSIFRQVCDTVRIGIPKLIVTTKYGPNRPDDLIVFPSVVDIAGKNRLLDQVLDNAGRSAAAIALAQLQRSTTANTVTIGLTMLGITTAGVEAFRAALGDGIGELQVFHANGLGGRAMQKLAEDGRIDAVIDWTTSEFMDELTGGVCAAPVSRLGSATRAGIPLLVVPGGIDAIKLGITVPERFAGRPTIRHSPETTLVRSTAEENARLGRAMGAQLTSSRGAVRVLVPGRGFSSVSGPDGPFWDPAADAAWLAELQRSAVGVRVDVIDAHIDDPVFADAVARTYRELGVGHPGPKPPTD